MSALTAPPAPAFTRPLPVTEGDCFDDLDLDSPPVDPVDGLYYPDSEGLPLLDTEPGDDWYRHLKEAIKHHLADRLELYVAGNSFFYPERGGATKAFPLHRSTEFAASRARRRSGAMTATW